MCVSSSGGASLASSPAEPQGPRQALPTLTALGSVLAAWMFTRGYRTVQWLGPRSGLRDIQICIPNTVDINQRQENVRSALVF